MVAMVNHTAVAALHRESTHGDGGHASGGDLQRGGGGGGGLQENNSTSPGDHVDDQADGPFVWETTVSSTDLQKKTKSEPNIFQEQGYVLSAYFVGYFITQVIDKFGQTNLVKTKEQILYHTFRYLAGVWQNCIVVGK